MLTLNIPDSIFSHDFLSKIAPHSKHCRKPPKVIRTLSCSQGVCFNLSIAILWQMLWSASFLARIFCIYCPLSFFNSSQPHLKSAPLQRTTLSVDFNLQGAQSLSLARGRLNNNVSKVCGINFYNP